MFSSCLPLKLVLILWIAISPLWAVAQQRGFQTDTATVAPIEISDLDGNTIGTYQYSYALLIGIDDYQNGWPRLKGVNDDLDTVRRELEQRGFQVYIVKNPDDQQLKRAFDGFINRFGVKEYHRLLFYYAGHGHSEKQTYGGSMGYLVPRNAPNPKQDRAGFLKTAMDMQQIEVYAKRIQSHHAIFLFDSCFSGTIFSLPRSGHQPIDVVFNQPVRQFITSGSADETVPDISIFRRQLLTGLDGEADLNGDGNITGSELGEHLSQSVALYSKKTQHPQYGKIQNPYLDKGEFVFRVQTDPKNRTGKTYLLNDPIETYDNFEPYSQERLLALGADVNDKKLLTPDMKAVRKPDTDQPGIFKTTPADSGVEVPVTTTEKSSWITQIDQPYFNGLYFRQSPRKDLFGREKMCTVFYRFFPDGTVMSWFYWHLSCADSSPPSNPKTLATVAQSLCKLEGCREEFEIESVYTQPDVYPQHTVELEEYRWKFNQKRELVFVYETRDNINNRLMPAKQRELVLGPMFRAGIRNLEVDSGLHDNDLRNWRLLFLHYDGLKSTTAPCNYQHLLERGNIVFARSQSAPEEQQNALLQKAKRWYYSATQCNFSKQEGHLKMAKALEAEGNLIWAAESYMDILKTFPGDESAVENAVRLHHQRGHYEQAFDIIQGFINNYPQAGASVFAAYAQAGMMTCQCDLTIRAVKQARQKGSRDPLLNHYLGVCSLYAGDVGNAINHFRQRSQKDQFKYTQHGIVELVKAPYRLYRSEPYQKWFRSLPKGQPGKMRYSRNCLKKKRP